MLRRILILIAAMALLLTPCAGAEDLYEQLDAALHRIILRTDEGDIPLGSGVLFVDPAAILTAEGCCAPGKLYAIGTDGEHEVQSVHLLGSGAALLTLGTPSPATPLTLAPEDVQSLPFLFGTNAEGGRGTMPLYKARMDMQDGLRTLLFSSEDSLQPGAFLVDQEGRLTALITGQRMEGAGSYAALGVTALSELLSTQEKDDNGLLKCAFSWESGELTVSWTDANHHDGVYILSLISGQNQYYTSYEAPITERSITITLPPGHTYSFQVQRTDSAASALPPEWAHVQDYTLPLLAYQAYNIQAECSMLSLPAGANDTGNALPLTVFPAGALTDPARDILLNVDCSYSIPAERSAAVALELLSPDGQFFFDGQHITLDPAAAAEDCFLLPLDDLLESCAEFSGGKLREGPYTLRFYLDGLSAGEYAFTVTPGDALPAPAATPVPQTPATSGYASGVSAVEENGLITLTWDAASVPQGAKIRAYYLYDGNTYYIYHEPEAGSGSDELFSVPGRETAAWVAWSADESFTMSAQPGRDQFVLLDAPPEEPLTDHGFRNIRIGLAASADPQAGSSTTFLPQAPITREMLSDRSTPIYFMTEDAYQVAATTGEHPLLILLETPEGLCFPDMGYYIFDRALQSSDLWVKDISKLFADYESFTGDAAWPAGEYRLLYCIDGKTAGEILFTLE